MCVSKCSLCNKLFVEPGSFEEHSCVTALRALSRKELLDKLYASGGCSKEYYETELKKLLGEEK